jgi:DNA-binding CsgD family transcriptional regulator
MNHVIFLYEIICYSVGGIGVLFAVLTGALAKSMIDRRYAAFMASFTIILVSNSFDVYTGNAGVWAGNMILISSFVELAGMSLMIAVLPRFIHSMAALSFERILNRIFAALGLASYAMVILAGLGFPPLWLANVEFGLLTAVIVYAVVAGNIFLRVWPRRDLTPAETSRWHRIMRSATVLTTAFIPFFVLIDFFPQLLPSLSDRLPKSLRAFPVFYLLWNLIYILNTLPLYFRRTAAAEGEWDFDRFELSPREREVASLLLEGFSYKEIADRLSVSMATVKTHVNRIYDKTGAGNKIELGRMLAARPLSTDFPTPADSK